MKTVIVAGALANKPNNGGEAWVRLSWVRAFQLLGFRVTFLEQITTPTPEAVAYFERVTRAFNLDTTLMSDDGRVISGSTDDRTADLLVNISGHLKIADVIKRVRRTAYVDIDPGYTQIWHEQGLAPIARHDFYFTIGANIGRPECPIPAGGINWRHVRQPVVLEDWPVLPPPQEIRFTTVAAWRGSFGSATWNDRTFGQKAHEFRKFVGLPRRARHDFELALQIHPGDAKDRVSLEAAGWRIVDPQAVAADPAAFRRYVQNSSAEFSVAQGIYVDTKSGWFSDRSTRYLASGRPVLVQSTGNIGVPWGVGIVTFDTLEGAVAGADKIVRDYPRHAAAAREIAEEYFDSHKVLGRMLDEVGVSRP